MASTSGSEPQAPRPPGQPPAPRPARVEPPVAPGFTARKGPSRPAPRAPQAAGCGQRSGCSAAPPQREATTPALLPRVQVKRCFQNPRGVEGKDQTNPMRNEDVTPTWGPVGGRRGGWGLGRGSLGEQGRGSLGGGEAAWVGEGRPGWGRGSLGGGEAAGWREAARAGERLARAPPGRSDTPAHSCYSGYEQGCVRPPRGAWKPLLQRRPGMEEVCPPRPLPPRSHRRRPAGTPRTEQLVLGLAHPWAWRREGWAAPSHPHPTGLATGDRPHAGLPCTPTAPGQCPQTQDAPTPCRHRCVLPGALAASRHGDTWASRKDPERTTEPASPGANSCH